MFFKNIYVFAFTRPFTTTTNELMEALQENTFTPLGSTEMSHYGWFNSLGKGSAELTESNGSILMCARKEEKILPAPVIKDMLDNKIEALESDQSRGATKKEKEQLKEDVIFELLPRAFNRITDTHGYINAEENIIVINSSSRGKAEDFLSLLRKSLGTLPVTSIEPDESPDVTMTEWVNSATTPNAFNGDLFTAGTDVSLNSMGDESEVVNIKNMDLNCDEFRFHLENEMLVTKIALEYDDAISFVLSDDLSIKRIKFFDVIQEQNDDIDCDDINAKLNADFTLMAGELNRMIHNLYAEFDCKTTDILDA